MDGYTSKRAADGLVVPGKGSGIILKDHVNNRERNAQFCNRIGCSGRLNSMKGTLSGCSEKSKSSRPPYRTSSSGKEIIGSSSRDEPEGSELISPPGKIQRGLQPGADDADSREVRVMEVGSSCAATNTKPRRSFSQRSGLGNQDALASPSVTLASCSASLATRANTSRYSLRNIKCNSISDVVPSGCSSSDSSLSRRKDTVKKRNADGEGSSSTKGKKLSGSSLEGRSNVSSHGVSISDSRRARNWSPNSDSIASSVRTRRSSSCYGRGRLPNQDNGSILTLNEPPVVMPQVPQAAVTIDLSAPVSTETGSTCASSYGRAGRISDSLHSIIPSIPSEAGINRSSMTGDSFRRYNMDGIAEVLLALERIEQDEELTYEQLLVLETSLFLNGLNFYDQHRDMRLDIDNMSYEELLALEERMGNVSTALSEEAMSKCLKKSIYEAISMEDVAKVSCEVEKDDVKCSICQEEYVVGDEVGRLQCEHRYHVGCIRQWLQVKNWCPICKASAEAMQSSCSSQN
ncbi:hypothetical protein ES332_D07G007100v1 [Gossypium tomentosum]|uniref:RING-type E3 ubiquitin transferase n=1 Tax=Gossypium tomentosum TaxID=34277 RepID=A0A5D2K2V8_GOSTO|nr:hypothetical protein ES332_D07G007100v1 [Gossypium tomentosum]TYH60835.1 hypothetical protein ES332_D07G007100v1 [Gossypium tomentosum]